MVRIVWRCSMYSHTGAKLMNSYMLGIIIVCFSLTQHMNNVGWHAQLYTQYSSEPPSFLPHPFLPILSPSPRRRCVFPLCRDNGLTEQQSQIAAHHAYSASLPSEEEARRVSGGGTGDEDKGCLYPFCLAS